jgi:CBS domain-containing protein
MFGLSVQLSKKIHRLPVVNGEGKLVGVLSRGNLVKAALAVRKAAAQQQRANSN